MGACYVEGRGVLSIFYNFGTFSYQHQAKTFWPDCGVWILILGHYVAGLLVRPTLARILILDLGFRILERYVAVLFVQILDLDFGSQIWDFEFCILGHVLNLT